MIDFQRGIDYILEEDLPNDEVGPFLKWLYGQTRPVVIENDVEYIGIYKGDYDRWWFYQNNKNITPLFWD